jgi:hypothetical protein
MNNIGLKTKVQEEFEKTMSLAEGFTVSNSPLHEIEKDIFKQLLKLGMSILSYIIQEKIRKLQLLGPPKKDGKALRSKGVKSCRYLSIFGLVEITRPSYWTKELGKFYPTDSELRLPVDSFWSYLISELIGESASESDYRESVRVVNKLLDLGIGWKSSERNMSNLGKEVEAYYASKTIELDSSAVCYSASFDGKGVPKIKGKVIGEVTSNPKIRLGKGEKRGVMEMATVGVISSFTPKKRSSAGIIDSLMGKESREKDSKGAKLLEEAIQDNTWHKGIHRRAYLGDQGKAVEYGLNRIKQMMCNSQSRFVVPIDAGAGLEEKVLAWVKEHEMEAQFDGIILDIIHVSEYVWDAAAAIFAEKSKSKIAWVRGILTDLLKSKTSKVIADLTRIKSQNGLSESKQKQLERTITYFTNHQHKMDYKTFIEKGYPVSSALVESACRHLVKERMEQSGMRWSSKGAQNVMDLRAVKINNDMEDFMRFRIENEQKSAFKYAA